MDQLDLGNLLLTDMQFFTKPTANGLDQSALIENTPVAFAAMLDQETALPVIKQAPIEVPQTFTSTFNTVTTLTKMVEEPISQPRLTTAVTDDNFERVLDVNFLNDDMHVKQPWEQHKGKHVHPSPTPPNDLYVETDKYSIENIVNLEHQPLYSSPKVSTPQIPQYTPPLQHTENNIVLDGSQNIAYNFTPASVTSLNVVNLNNHEEVHEQNELDNSPVIKNAQHVAPITLPNHPLIKHTPNIDQLANLQVANDSLPINDELALLPAMTLSPQKPIIEKNPEIITAQATERDDHGDFNDPIALSLPITLPIASQKMQPQPNEIIADMVKTQYFTMNPLARGDAIKNSIKPDELISMESVKLVMTKPIHDQAIEDFTLPQSTNQLKQTLAGDAAISYTPKPMDAFEPMVTEVTNQSLPQQAKTEDLQILNLQVRPASNMMTELKPTEIAHFTTNLPQLQSAVIEQVVNKLSAYVGDKDMDSIKVALHPADLGEVEISFDFSNKQQTKVEILAEKFMTYDLLVRNIKEIEEQLHSLKADGNNLNFGLKNDSQGEGRGQQQSPYKFDHQTMFVENNDATLNINLPINLGDNKLDILV